MWDRLEPIHSSSFYTASVAGKRQLKACQMCRNSATVDDTAVYDFKQLLKPLYSKRYFVTQQL